MISTILIIGVAGIVGYFIYEKYIKKSDNLSTNSVLTQSGLLNNTGVQSDNNVSGSPLLYASLSPNSLEYIATVNNINNINNINNNLNALTFMGNLNHEVTRSIENALGINWQWGL